MLQVCFLLTQTFMQVSLFATTKWVKSPRLLPSPADGKHLLWHQGLECGQMSNILNVWNTSLLRVMCGYQTHISVYLFLKLKYTFTWKYDMYFIDLVPLYVHTFILKAVFSHIWLWLSCVRWSTTTYTYSVYSCAVHRGSLLGFSHFLHPHYVPPDKKIPIASCVPVALNGHSIFHIVWYHYNHPTTSAGSLRLNWT